MTNFATDNLSKTKIQQLLNAVRTCATKDDSNDVNAVDYDWAGSHYFNKTQFEALEKFAEKIAYQCSEKFTELYKSKFDVETTSIEQHLAEELFNPENASDCYYMAFGPDLQKPFGLMEISVKSALVWTTQILGETVDQTDAEVRLSKLEESLLLDITAGLIKALSTAYQEHELYPINKIKLNNVPFDMKETDEICKIEFAAGKAETEEKHSAAFLIFCEKLDTIAGKQSQANVPSAESNSVAAVRGHLDKVEVSMKVKLGQAVFNLSEIMGIQPGDVVVLDKTVSQPLEVIINNRTVFGARLVKSENNCAIKITENYDNK